MNKSELKICQILFASFVSNYDSVPVTDLIPEKQIDLLYNSNSKTEIEQLIFYFYPVWGANPGSFAYFNTAYR
jgi:hypothetical protein